MSRRLDLGKFVSRSTIIAGTAFGLRDASPLMTPDVAQSPPGHVWNSSQNIFSDEPQQEARRDKPGHPHHADHHDFERRRAKTHTPHFHESSFHSTVRHDGESGFTSGVTGFDPQSAISMGTIYSAFSEGEHYEPSTAGVSKHGKVLAKLISGIASDRQNGEGGEAGKSRMRDLNTLEYQLRHFTSLSPQQQQEAAASFFSIASDLPPAPEGWLPDLTPEQMNWFLGEVAVGAVAGAAMALAYEATTKKGLKKALPVLASMSMLISACGGNVVSTATALVDGTARVPATALADPNVRVSTAIPFVPTDVPRDLETAVLKGGGAGGQYITCEAAAGALIETSRKTPDGIFIPTGIMQPHNPDPNKWSLDEKGALIDAQGKSIAPTIDIIKAAIEKINPKIRVKTIVSGEGYVLELIDEKGNHVWAVDQNDIAHFRPDIVAGTTKFRIISDPPIDGDQKYIVTGGCGVLGVFDKKTGKMIAVYKPLANKWELFLPPTAVAPAVPTATSAPVPSPTPDLKNFVPTNFNNCCALNSEYANYRAKEKFDAINTPAFQDRIKKIKEDPKYQKPSFALEPVHDPLGKDIKYQYTSFYQMAIYAGGYDVVLPDMDWSIGKGEVKVKMHIYIPVEKPDTYIITIARITDNIGSGDSVLGTRFYYKKGTLPDGRPALLAQIGQEPTPGQMFQIFEATGMGLVDVFNASKTSSQYNKGYIAQGNSLSGHIGMTGADSIAKQILALSDQDARGALMKTFFDSQKIHLLVEARLQE